MIWCEAEDSSTKQKLNANPKTSNAGGGDPPIRRNKRPLDGPAGATGLNRDKHLQLHQNFVIRDFLCARPAEGSCLPHDAQGSAYPVSLLDLLFPVQFSVLLLPRTSSKPYLPLFEGTIVIDLDIDGVHESRSPLFCAEP